MNCGARDLGSLHVGADSISFTIAQRIRLEAKEQLWESMQMHCQKEADGSLTVRVLLWYPELEDALQIALLRSRPDETSARPKPLEIDLNQKALR